MDSAIQKNLEYFLRPDEHILWRSKTRPFGITEGREGKAVLLQWILSTICILGFLGLVFAYGRASTAVIILLLLLLAILIGAPLLSFRSLSSQEYVITDQRVMTVKADGCANAIERENVDGCKLMPLDFKGMTLVVGSSLFPEGDKQLRWRALHPKLGRYAKSEDGLTIAEGLVFYNVTDADTALKLLRQPV